MNVDRRSVYKLCAFLFFFHSSVTLIISYLPVYFAQEKGLSGTEIGWLLAIGPFAAIFSQPFWGYMSDKYKTVKYIMIICMASVLICSYFLFQMNVLTALLIASFFLFAFMSPVGALGDSLVQKTAVQQKVSFGRIRMWGSLGFACTALIGGQILDFIGIENLSYVYLVYASIAFFVCLIISDVKINNKPVTVINALELRKNIPFMMFLLVIILITISHRANDSFLGLYITELGGTEKQIGWAWFIAVTTEAIVFATSAIWFRRYHPLTFIFISGVIYSIRWILLSFVSTAEMLLALQFLHGINFGLFYLVAFQYVTRLVPEELQATGHLLLISVFFGLSGIIGSIAGGAILEHAGGSILYLTMGGLALLGSLFVIIYKLYITRDKQKALEESKHFYGM